MINKLFFLLPAILFNNQIAYSQNTLPAKGICAHRGAMDTHPENTIAAFKEAIRLHAQMIEFDVRLTKDNKLVILHDETVDRTTNGTGKIEDLTIKQVKRLDAGSWKSQKFKGEKIPTFEETLSIMPDDIWLNIHLKGGGKLGKKVAKILIEQDRHRQAFLACGTSAAAAAHKVNSEIIICNMERQADTETYVEQTIASKNEFIQLYKVTVTPKIADYTKKLKSNNVKINYCCTDSPEDIKMLFDYGVEFVLVNELGKMMDSLNLEIK